MCIRDRSTWGRNPSFRLLLCISAVVLTAQAANYIRATWLPAGFGDATEQEIETTVRTLAGYGVNRLYPCVWNNGEVFFNSPTYQKLTGITTYKDNLGQYLKYAKKYGIQVIPWFEFGLMAEFAGAKTTFGNIIKKLGWYIGDADGFSWMHPAKATKFLANLMVDAHDNYDIDGVQVDDHFAYPRAIPGASEWIMTNAAKELFEIIKAKHKKIISLSPAPLDWALNKYSINWKLWDDIGYFEEFVPQLYYATRTSVLNEIGSMKKRMNSAQLRKVIIGIMINREEGAVTAWSEVEGILKAVQSEGFNVSVWYHFGILRNYASQLQKLWGFTPKQKAVEFEYSTDV
eukprot:TRINITY_DN17146_c0_g1_i1.p1 TRINITY_DN17146_c0_g1~~TRINITY_DN17146_c0_g1_i1.p1  ORF type:complete len:371 (+),score=82.65 TRINITY_DN17146_c0_g1_i1:80-1114(+)